MAKKNPQKIVSQRSYRTQTPRSTPRPKKKRNVSKKFRRLHFKTYNFQNSNPSKHKLSRKIYKKILILSFIYQPNNLQKNCEMLITKSNRVSFRSKIIYSVHKLKPKRNWGTYYLQDKKRNVKKMFHCKI
jgi:hypothetical protein